MIQQGPMFWSFLTGIVFGIVLVGATILWYKKTFRFEGAGTCGLCKKENVFRCNCRNCGTLVGMCCALGFNGPVGRTRWSYMYCPGCAPFKLHDHDEHDRKGGCATGVLQHHCAPSATNQPTLEEKKEL